MKALVQFNIGKTSLFQIHVSVWQCCIWALTSFQIFFSALLVHAFLEDDDDEKMHFRSRILAYRSQLHHPSRERHFRPHL